ncbi:MAG: SRPBCC family protein [Rhodothermaceae bacterium]|nr:SRPBCC family protein [Rhodothermaceae bacterium]
MDKKLIHLTADVTLDVPLERAWEVVALGFGDVAQYNPAIAASEFTSEQRAGVGTGRLCHVAPKGFLKEQITRWENQRFFELEVVDTSFPMHTVTSRFSFTPLGERTRVKQDFWYRMKPPMGWLSGLMKKPMQKTLDEGLNGLAHYLDHGEKLTPSLPSSMQ